MGLYLAVFEGDVELEGVEIGSYGDFEVFRNTVAELLEGGEAGRRFPVLMLHSDCDGSWAPEEAARLQAELEEIAAAFHAFPPREFANRSWQREVARVLGIKPVSLFDYFIDVDGEPLLDRLIALTRVSQEREAPILFQ